MRSSSSVLPWSTWPITVMTGGRGPLRVVVLVIVDRRAASGARPPAPRRGRRAGGRAPISAANSSIMLVGERLRGGDHLALLHEEAHDVGRGAVQLRRRAPAASTPRSMTIVALGHRRVGRRVGRRGPAAAAPRRLRRRRRLAAAAGGAARPAALPPGPPGPPPGPPEDHQAHHPVDRHRCAVRRRRPGHADHRRQRGGPPGPRPVRAGGRC